MSNTNRGGVPGRDRPVEERDTKKINGRVLIRILNPMVKDLPYKCRPSDPFWNVSLVERSNHNEIDDVQEIVPFSTGLTITPPLGYHIEFFASNELLSMGYEMPTPLIIGCENIDEIVVNLRKFKDTDNITLPCAGILMIVRPTCYAFFHTRVSDPDDSEHVMLPYNTEYLNSKGEGVPLRSISAGRTPRTAGSRTPGRTPTASTNRTPSRSKGGLY